MTYRQKCLSERFLKWAEEYEKNIYDNFNDDEWRLIMEVYRTLSDIDN